MSSHVAERPHAVFVPYPAQGHVHPMLNLAKILHSRGSYITFVHTEFNYQRMIRSRGPNSVKGLVDFRFETIPDGLPPPENYDATQDVPSLCDSTSKNCLAPFTELLGKLSGTPSVPQVSFIVSDGLMTFSLDAAEALQIPGFAFWTASACGMMGYLSIRKLMETGLVPLKDESYLVNEYLDTLIDWIPGMKDIRLKDLPSFIRTTDPSDIMLNFTSDQTHRCCNSTALIFNTFDDLEHQVLQALAPILPPIYTVGLLPLFSNQIITNSSLKSLGSNLWKEEMKWVEWLEKRDHSSVLYVNFGSITTMTRLQLAEFAWGLANSNHPFIWVVRGDLVKGEEAVVPSEFLAAANERGLVLGWVPQEEVLLHPSIGGFLTHCGWNSTIESLCGGVPVICWPFFAEQQMNCHYACTEWAMGMEIDKDVRRDEVESVVRELMEGEKGKEMRRKAREWRGAAEKATKPGGSSYENLDKMVRHMFSS